MDEGAVITKGGSTKNISGNPMKYVLATKSAGPATVMVAILLFAAASANAQRPIRHELIRGDMPPGLAADYSRMSNPALEHYVQPVRIIGPPGSLLEIAANGDFVETKSSKATVGMKIGPVYRFKVSNIPQTSGKELYPSIELLNRLHPPEGLENEFPVQVVIDLDDLKQALDGKLVTKVIYLENPETALPHRHREDVQPFFDVGGGEDPLRASEKLGRPMAILRIGSRVPMASDLMEQFNFSAPAPAMLPNPQSHQNPSNSDAGIDNVSSTNIPSLDNSPIGSGRIAPIPNRQK
jgi:hypothetical protein